MRGRPSVLRQAVDAFLGDHRRRGHSAATLSHLWCNLVRFLIFCQERRLTDPVQVTPLILGEFQIYLDQVYRCRSTSHRGPLAKATQVSTLYDVRQFFTFLVKSNQLLMSPASSLEIRPVRSVPIPPRVTVAQIEELVAVCDGETAAGLRDRAILEVLFGCGLRRGELVALDLYDVDLTAGIVLVRKGKGGKTRRVPIAGEALRALLEYVERGRYELLGARSGAALFLSQLGLRLTGKHLGRRIWNIARRAGWRQRPARPHAFRHGYATALIQGGAGIRAVQLLLGHARPDTSQIYTPLDWKDLCAVHRRTHPRERRA